MTPWDFNTLLEPKFSADSENHSNFLETLSVYEISWKNGNFRFCRIKWDFPLYCSNFFKNNIFEYQDIFLESKLNYLCSNVLKAEGSSNPNPKKKHKIKRYENNHDKMTLFSSLRADYSVNLYFKQDPMNQHFSKIKILCRLWKS